MNNNIFEENFKKHFSFYEHLSKDEKALLYNNTHSVHYSKNQNVHNGNENCVGIILVKTGQLRTYMLSDDGREITLYRLYEGDTCILSASCVLDAITFDVFIDAQQETDALIINAPVFHALADKNIYVEAFGYKLATTRFSDVMWAMQQILFMGIDKRLAIFLLDEIAKQKNDTIKLTHEQIAKYIGTAREVISRMLKYFENDDIVLLSRGGITVTDKAKLRQMTR